MYAASTNKYVSCVVEVPRNVDRWFPVSGGRCRLETCNFKSQSRLFGLTLALELCAVRWKIPQEIARDCETLTVDKVGRSGTDVWLQRRSNGEECRRKAPEPF